MSPYFQDLLGGVRTRRLAALIAKGDPTLQRKAEKILEKCGFKPRDKKAKEEDDDSEIERDSSSKMLIYTTHSAIEKMQEILKDSSLEEDEQAKRFAEVIEQEIVAPDMALSGRMLEPSGDLWKNRRTNVEASLQVAHALSTHGIQPEVDYYVAADDVPGEDAGAGYTDSAMFTSACFYKYFSINWEVLKSNLVSYGERHSDLAAHTVGAFLKAAALVTPTGKQNSFAAHNLPDGIVVDFRDFSLSYANAFAMPAARGERDLVSQSIAQLAQYIADMDAGYGRPIKRLWFSPNLRFPLIVLSKEPNGNRTQKELADVSFKSLDELISMTIETLGFKWEEVSKVKTQEKTSHE